MEAVGLEVVVSEGVYKGLTGVVQEVNGNTVTLGYYDGRRPRTIFLEKSKVFSPEKRGS